MHIRLVLSINECEPLLLRLAGVLASFTFFALSQQFWHRIFQTFQCYFSIVLSKYDINFKNVVLIIYEDTTLFCLC